MAKVSKAVKFLSGNGAFLEENNLEERSEDITSFTWGSQHLVPSDNEANSREFNQWELRNAKGVYGYSFWYRFISEKEVVSALIGSGK